MSCELRIGRGRDGGGGGGSDGGGRVVDLLWYMRW
jgi:hypothetical protein